MKTSTKRSRPRRPKIQPIPEQSPTVRMYDVGFGDCFLLRIPCPNGKVAKVLFDCGSIKIGANQMKDVVQQVISDARSAPSEPARIDVVIATHRHRDHISGFADPAWAQVEVGEVWMPWTENPEQPEANRIREIQSRMADQLVTRMQTRLALTNDLAVHSALELNIQLALNAQSNEDAMRTLQHGFAGRPNRRYLPEKSANTSWFETPLLPGIVIHVMGPSHDPQVLNELEPPAGQGYLKLIESGIGSQPNQPRPFGKDWLIPNGDYASDYSQLFNDLSPKDRENVQSVGIGLDESVAATLDKALNATSLMLMFQIGQVNLLFPGDAQWGSWRQALENQGFRKLLASTNFYKVGHHGSHNATPVEFVEQVLGENFWAMVSTTSVASWPKVPKQELLNSMAKKHGSKIARSDQPKNAKKPWFLVGQNGVIEACIKLVP